MPSDETMRRLAVARYLHVQAIEQGQKGDLLAGLALLSLHDAVEVFLRAAAEHHNITLPKSVEFLEYWTLFERESFPLPMKTRMDTFNRSRVEVKHRGILPAQHHVEGFRATVTEFLSIASRLLFGFEFEEISMSRLVRSDAVRADLQAAERSFLASDFEAALENAALGFRRALRNFKFGDPLATKDQQLLDPLKIGSEFRWYGLGQDSFVDNRLARSVGEAFDRVGEAITVVAYNLDYDGYRHLLTFGPVIFEKEGGEMQTQWTIKPTTDEGAVERCVAFAVDAALRLENAARSPAT
jgi:hypothetical protein